MRKHILVYMRVGEEIDELAETYEITQFLNHEYVGDPDFDRALEQADGILGLQLRVTKELIDRAPRLKIVSNTSTGFDNLDIDHLTERNIMATNTPGVLDETTADGVFAILIATARRVAELDHYVKSGQWEKQLQPHQYGVDVHRKTLGIIGMGSIGLEIAKRGHFGFNMDILYHNRSRNKEAEKLVNATYCELDDLLAQSDFVCLMVPATKETRHIIWKRAI